jgi:hypothetical protein
MLIEDAVFRLMVHTNAAFAAKFATQFSPVQRQRPKVYF